MVQGRSKKAFKTWLADRPQAWRDGVEVVAMDGFTGFKTAAPEELPDAVAVMDPFHAEVVVMPMSVVSPQVVAGALWWLASAALAAAFVLDFQIVQSSYCMHCAVAAWAGIFRMMM